jgi:(E)-4-hydroxy-3-methylbut-2-enyl-diphosphate synthase
MVRKKTTVAKIGSVYIGGQNPIAIQSMTKSVTADVDATVKQIQMLEEAGCEIIRCAIVDKTDAEAIREIKSRITIPLVADIHFDSRLAVKALKSGADKVRINPGNLGGEEKFLTVLEEAGNYGAAVRIGVNGGSLSKDLYERFGGASARALAEDALRYVDLAKRQGFDNIVVSLKSSSVADCVEANKLFSAQCDCPLHIGITEAGTYEDGIIKSAAGLGALLLEGIGDTLRVSLSEEPVREVYAAKKILSHTGVRRGGAEVISCPTCGRCKADVIGYARQVRALTREVAPYIKIAVMGCAVNGPGEARDADVGLAFGADSAVLFEKGIQVAAVKAEEAVELLMQCIQQIAGQGL